MRGHGKSHSLAFNFLHREVLLFPLDEGRGGVATRHNVTSKHQGAEVMLQFYPRSTMRLAELGLLHTFVSHESVCDNVDLLLGAGLT